MIELREVNIGLWFQHGKPIENPDWSHRVGNILHCRTIKKARRIATGILNRWPNAIVHIMRSFKKQGQKYIRVETWRN